MSFRINLKLIEKTRVSIRELRKWAKKRDKKGLSTRTLERAIATHVEWLQILGVEDDGV